MSLDATTRSRPGPLRSAGSEAGAASSIVDTSAVARSGQGRVALEVYVHTVTVEKRMVTAREACRAWQHPPPLTDKRAWGYLCRILRLICINVKEGHGMHTHAGIFFIRTGCLNTSAFIHVHV